LQVSLFGFLEDIAIFVDYLLSSLTARTRMPMYCYELEERIIALEEGIDALTDDVASIRCPCGEKA
jgi:hypothetical protein